MRAIDKLDRLGIEGVRMLLGKGRKDESGDFTKGAGEQTDSIRPQAAHSRRWVDNGRQRIG